jgi:hypothetical protein
MIQRRHTYISNNVDTHLFYPTTMHLQQTNKIVNNLRAIHFFESRSCMTTNIIGKILQILINAMQLKHIKISQEIYN